MGRINKIGDEKLEKLDPDKLNQLEKLLVQFKELAETDEATKIMGEIDVILSKVENPKE